MELFTREPDVVVAVYAHPDDADVGCGGALALWAKRGCGVHLIVLTDGGRGTTDPAVNPRELASRRREELRASASVLGLASVENLDIADGEVESAHSLRATLVARIRELRPEIVIGHDPTAIFFGQDYFNHVDHRAAGWALLDAVAPATSLPHYFPDAGAPHQVSEVLLSGTLEPDVFVDIATTIDLKAKAIECHRSQFVDNERWAGEVARARAEQEGKRAGTNYAEGFRRLRLAP